MDLQAMVFKLDRYWARQGCALLPPGSAVTGCRHSLAGAAGRAGHSSDGLEGFYRYRVSLSPAPASARRLFLDSLRAAGLDRSEHDLLWLPWEGPGWDVLLDGLPLARFSYKPSSEGGRAAAAEAELSLERLALAVQRRKTADSLAWAGRLTYGELHGGEAA